MQSHFGYGVSQSDNNLAQACADYLYDFPTHEEYSLFTLKEFPPIVEFYQVQHNEQFEPEQERLKALAAALEEYKPIEIAGLVATDEEKITYYRSMLNVRSNNATMPLPVCCLC